MAMTCSIQTTLATPMRTTHITTRTMFSQFSPSSYVPNLHQRNSNMRVRCNAEENEKEDSIPVVAPPPPIQPNTARLPKISTNFSDVLAFSGPAPERINGRLAMIGFVAAIGVEVANGQGVFSQLSDGGIPWFIGTSIVLSLASLIPLFKGVTVQSKSEGIMTADAEMWNGRFAMLGLVALVFTEYLKGSALV